MSCKATSELILDKSYGSKIVPRPSLSGVAVVGAAAAVAVGVAAAAVAVVVAVAAAAVVAVAVLSISFAEKKMRAVVGV